jgi:MerR family transcriptional regulator, light-induced transcriptional regulator
MATMFEGRANPQNAKAASPRYGSRALWRSRVSPATAPISVSTIDTLIQGEIIPRLLIAHPSLPYDGVGREPGAYVITPNEADRFGPLALVLEANELLDRVEGYLARGASVESIFVDLLAPAARQLGKFWEDDVCDFVDVTMGLWRLQEVMREIAMRVPGVAQSIQAPRCALFSPMPGEQHSFGALMVAEVFSRAGWTSESLIEPCRQELLQVLAATNFDLVGLTVSCDCPSGALSSLITAMRSVSKNPVIQVLIGGRAVNAEPALAERVGADGTAPDGRSALALANARIPQSGLLERAV